MKNIFTCFLLLGITYSCNAQDYVPMVVEGSCWEFRVYDHIALPPPEDYYFDIGITEDTLINEILYYSVDNGNSGFLREDPLEQRVYFLRGETEGGPLVPQCDSLDIYETLLYDFSANIGDTVYICRDSAYFYVVLDILEEVYTYNIPQGSYYGFDTARVFIVNAQFAAYNGQLYIREGIGGGFGPFIPFMNISSTESISQIAYKRDCSFNVATENFIGFDVIIAPNPVQNILNIKIGEEIELSEVKIYDISGQLQELNKLSGNTSINVKSLPNGLYFITGYDEKKKQIFNQKIIKID